jgi:hypothetical protein
MGKKWLELMGIAAIALLGVACADTGVGDSCVPEQVPAGGFLASETYLETSSVQCATRVCLVRGLQGDPSKICEDTDPEEEPECVPRAEVEETTYCSCRCAAPAGSGLPTCECPGGFSCEPVLETGGDGLRGSYCVRIPSDEPEM